MSGNFQRCVRAWVTATFGPHVAVDIEERRLRFAEEALELVQSVGMSREIAHAMVDYVFDRPRGKVAQEIGGTAVTFAALCDALAIDMEDVAWHEVWRIIGKSEEIRAKQRTKPLQSDIARAALGEQRQGN